MKLFALTFLLLFAGSVTAQEYYMLAGTYNSPKSEGIYVYKFSSRDGTVKEISHVKTSNPSFLSISPDNKYVYAVNENGDSTGKGGSITSFLFDKKKGTLKQLSRQSSQGNYPCYITVDKTGKWVLAGNYGSGNFSILPVRNGVLGKAIKTIQHTGSGPDTARQKSAHVHGIFMKKDNTGFYVTDLGTDKLMNYNFNAKTGNVTPAKFPVSFTNPGSGPRHLDFHPKLPIIYLLNELQGGIDVLKNELSGECTLMQNLAAFPPYYRGQAGSADIHISQDGKFLYCSNRGGLNNIGIFSVDSASGLITYISEQSSLGEKPRNFNFDPSGKYLLIANQNSDEIVIFKRDTQTGLLTDTGNRVKTGRPVCIKWIQ